MYILGVPVLKAVVSDALIFVIPWEEKRRVVFPCFLHFLDVHQEYFNEDLKVRKLSGSIHIFIELSIRCKSNLKIIYTNFISLLLLDLGNLLKE